MVIKLTPDVEAALTQIATREGTDAETVALNALRERFVPTKPPIEPRDEWERRLLALGTDCGVSVPDEALSSEGLYD
jgi:hypothetical protein